MVGFDFDGVAFTWYTAERPPSRAVEPGDEWLPNIDRPEERWRYDGEDWLRVGG